MFASFLLSLREGLEAALVIGIILSVLRHSNRTQYNPAVWRGVFAGIVSSIAFAGLLAWLGAELSSRAEKIFEGITMLLAAGLLTWMIFWMQKQSRHIREDIKQDVDQALLKNGATGLFWLAFFVIVREGVELSIFLVASTFGSTALNTFLGASAGLFTSIVLGWMTFNSTRKLNIKIFFQVTNILLLLFAAGMVAYGVHELNEAQIIPAIIDPIWNINPILNEKSTIGLFLKSLFGYNGNPSLSEFLAYASYLLIISVQIFRPKPKVKFAA